MPIDIETIITNCANSSDMWLEIQNELLFLQGFEIKTNLLVGTLIL